MYIANISVVRNTFLILLSFLFFVCLSVVVGLSVGYFSDAYRRIKERTAARLDPQYVPTLVESFQTTYFDKPPQRNRTDLIFTPPLCAIKFTEQELTMPDLGYMSKAAYEPTSAGALAMINKNEKLRDEWSVGLFNLGSNKHLQNTTDTSNYNVTSGVHFVEFVHKKAGLSVVAIRGTRDLEDAFQDLYLWSTVVFLQGSSYFGTLVNAWPTQTVAYINYLITTYLSYPSLLYWAEMQEIIERIIHEKPHTQQRPEVLNRLMGVTSRMDSVQSQVMVILLY